MEKDRLSEDQYLKAKIAYYEGDPIMSDSEFDVLENHLRNLESKVIEQVGMKRKDFDFEHPTKMLSLGKIQTEAREDGTTNYAIDDFDKWYQKNRAKVGEVLLVSSPKFDGNAINIIFQGNKLVNVLTRGDGFTGKDITKRFLPYINNELELVDLDVSENDVIEIRAEVVIDINLFNEKYAVDFANARNYVAGVIGKDDFDEVKVSELQIVPLHYLVNGKFVAHRHFIKNSFCSDSFDIPFRPTDYRMIIEKYEEMRKEIQYQLDGVVISFPIEHRVKLGVNDHDPEWALAVKFVPVETITEVEGIEWNISKRGELIPTLLLKPVFLDGSTVKRASGYNAGYVIKNGLGVGAKISIAKAGDIIPEVQKVLVKTTRNEIPLPAHCSDCGEHLLNNVVHYYCPNEDCSGRIAKQLSGAVKTLDIMRVGEKTIKPFAGDFKNMYQLIKWVYKSGHTEEIENYGIVYGSRSQEIFVQAFKNIKSLTYEQVIRMLGYDNVGRKISTQLAREHAGLDYDYAHLEKALVEKLRSRDVSVFIKNVVEGLEELGIKIDRPKEEKKDSSACGICMTGSPKAFGFKTKAEFISQFPAAYEVKLTDSDCKFLITDDLSSTSNKMKTAEKKGIQIKTYEDFKI